MLKILRFQDFGNFELSPLYTANFSHLSQASFLWDIGKQCITRLEATECVV